MDHQINRSSLMARMIINRYLTKLLVDQKAEFCECYELSPIELNSSIQMNLEYSFFSFKKLIMMKDLVFKTATIHDFDRAWDLFEESLSGQKTRLTYSSLRDDLFCQRKLGWDDAPANRCDDPSIEFDLGQAETSVPFCQVILAQVGHDQVGHIMFHQFYSPWKGRKAFIDYIYVKPSYRNMGE